MCAALSRNRRDRPQIATAAAMPRIPPAPRPRLRSRAVHIHHRHVDDDANGYLRYSVTSAEIPHPVG